MPPTDKHSGDKQMKFSGGKKKTAAKQFIEILVPIKSHYRRDKSKRQ